MRRAVLALLLLCWVPAWAAADPVTLTSGNIAVGGPYSTDFGFGSFDFAGSAFAAGGGGGGVAPHLGSFDAGVVDLSGTVGVGANGPGYVTTGGQTLHGFATATFQVTAVPAAVVPDWGGRGGSVQTPFTARGLVQLFAFGGGGKPIFSQEVVGSGKASIGGINVGNGQYLTSVMALTFGPDTTDPGSPTPEPASLLLLGTGLAAAWQSRRLRRVS